MNTSKRGPDSRPTSCESWNDSAGSQRSIPRSRMGATMPRRDRAPLALRRAIGRCPRPATAPVTAARPVVVRFYVQVDGMTRQYRTHQFERAEWLELDESQRHDMLTEHLDAFTIEVVGGGWEIDDPNDASAPGAACPFENGGTADA